MTFTFNRQRLRFSTGLNASEKSWSEEDQKAKPLKDYPDENKGIREINNFLLDTYDKVFPKGQKVSKEEVKQKSEERSERYQVFMTGMKKKRRVEVQPL